MTSYAVEIKNVCKRFPLPTGGELEACKDINITLEKGQSLGIVGESGSGKTTLVRMIMKMLPITEGEIYVDGVEIQHMNSEQTKEYRKKIQMVFQDPSAAFNPRMKVKDIILEPLYNFGLLEKGKEEQIAGDYLEMVDLPREFMHRYPHEMSGGQRQRLAIASVLATNPTVLVLDEPTSSLDPDGTAELYRLVGDLNQKHGITVVVIDHDLHAVLPYANRMALMVDGSIACDDDVPTTLRYMYEHNIHVDALPSVFTTYMELEQAGFHSDEPWLSIESAIKGLHQIEMAHAIQTEVHGKSNSPANQRNIVDNLADHSNIVENRQPVQRVDDVQGKDGGAHA